MLRGTDGENVLKTVEKNSIFPEDGPAEVSADLSHLSDTSKQLYEQLILEYGNVWATHREHRGEFTGFSVRAIIDKNSKISCKQVPRHKSLPASCIADPEKYKQAGLFQQLPKKHATQLRPRETCLNNTKRPHHEHTFHNSH